MKKIDLQGKNIDELNRDLKEEQKALFDLRIDNELRKLKNGKSINLKRKQIARLKTEITNKELINAR